MRDFLVLGAGFTGLRVVRLLQSQGLTVRWTTRSGGNGAVPFNATDWSAPELLDLIGPHTAILYSIPTLKTGSRLHEATPDLIAAMRTQPPARIVYLSTTGVYGPTHMVDHVTEPHPVTERERLRREAEESVGTGPWSSLILRPAAIYGPYRGIHAGMRTGQFHLAADASNFVSRIHVDDLATHCCAALLADVQGAFPVADDDPCTSFEAAEFCAKLLNVALPSARPASELGETRRADRRVDGSAIRKILGIELRYPSYKTGFPACLAEETRLRSIS